MKPMHIAMSLLSAAMFFVLAGVNIKQEEIMAIGDQENDIAMIEFAGVGVAMDNAIPTVKEAANFITKSNLEDGVAWAIEKYVLS